MIWGKTELKRFLEEQELRRKEGIWKLWFAWHPVRLTKDGRWIWWEVIEHKIDTGITGSYRNFYRLRSRNYEMERIFK